MVSLLGKTFVPEKTRLFAEILFNVIFVQCRHLSKNREKNG